MGPIDENEPIVWFILTRSHINWEKTEHPRLRPEAFMPHPNIQLSVFRVGELDQLEVQQIDETVAFQRSKTLVGCGCLLVKHVIQTKLSVQPKEPPPRHADIVGWPVLSGNSKEEKSRQKLLSMELIERATLVLV